MRPDVRAGWVRPARPARAAALMAAFSLAAVVAASPAAAAPSPTPPRPTADCIILGDNSTFQAVFGYEKGKGTTDVPIGSKNTLTPSSFNGVQPTHFVQGWQPAQFATSAVAIANSVSWTINGWTATADRRTPTCGQEISLPAEGNGVGAVLVLAGSVLLSTLLYRIRRWRHRRRAA